MSHQPSRSNEIEDFERTFYDSWRDFWSEESQYTEQTYLTADTVGIIKDYCKGLLTRIVQAKDAETKRAVEEERERIVKWIEENESWDEWGKENPHIFANELREYLITP